MRAIGMEGGGGFGVLTENVEQEEEYAVIFELV
jgi:hypothetical protein